MFDCNDNELLYLIKEHNEYALDIMHRKYLPLIKTRIKKFNIKRDYEDFIQEGYIALNVAIKRYRTTFHKSFNKYFDLLLQRRFICILRKEEKHFYKIVYCEDLSYLYEEPKEEEVYKVDDLPKMGFLSCLEKEVYRLVYEKGYKAREIAMEIGIEVERVYNALGRIKRKVEAHDLQIKK